MSIFPSRNWTAELRQQSANESQLTAFRQAQWNAELDRAVAKTTAMVEESSIAKDANEGTVIEGVVVKRR